MNSCLTHYTVPIDVCGNGRPVANDEIGKSKFQLDWIERFRASVPLNPLLRAFNGFLLATKTQA